MPRYIIPRADQPPPLAGDIAGTPWARASAARLANYPWYEAGRTQSTIVRLLWDVRALYVQFRCQDRHSSAATTQLNGPVWQDSSVELFASPCPQERPDYFNLEINCCGVVLMGYGPGREGRRPITPELARRLSVRTTFAGPTKAESPDDRAWWAAAAIPFDLLGDFTTRQVRPEAGTLWRGNFYRCGGRTDPQHACWSRIDWPTPDFHRPEFFGKLVFG